MNRTAAEIIRHLEARIARLEGRTASTARTASEKTLTDPVIISRSLNGSSIRIEVFGKKAEQRHIGATAQLKGGDHVFEGTLYFTSKMFYSVYAFYDEAEAENFLNELSVKYTVIVANYR